MASEPPGAVLRALLDLRMASDPTPLTSEQDQAVTEWLSEVSHERGYGGWVDAYHEFEVRS